MLVLITYDVNTQNADGRKRLRKVAKTCIDCGRRVQNSVFECELNAGQLLKTKERLLKQIDQSKDSLRIYSLGNNYQGKIEHFGINPSFDVTEPLIV